MKEKKILMNYLLYTLAFIGLCIVGITNALAATTKTIYPSNNFTQNANNYLKLNESGTFGITNTNLTIQGQSYGFNFYMQENVVLNKTYTIVITFMADDLRSDFQNNYVHVNVGSGSTSSSVSIVSITRNNPTGYSTTLTIKFNPLTTGDYIQVNIISDGPPYAVLTGVSTYGIKNVTLDSSADSQDIINNQNQNTQDIINAQQSSASNIINAQQSSASDIMANQDKNAMNAIYNDYTCKIQTITNYNGAENVALNSTGAAVNADNFVISDYILLYPDKTYTLTKENWGSARAYCLYNFDKELLSCTTYSTSTSFSFTGAYYIRYTWSRGNNRTVNLYGDICLKDSEQQTNAINNLNGNMTSDDVDSSSASSFFSNFNDNNHGLSGVVSAPLVAINAMLNNQCTPLTATWRETAVSLPCGYDFWSKMTGFQQFLNVALDGLLCYRILVKIFKLVEKFKNPNDDRVEVMDL